LVWIGSEAGECSDLIIEVLAMCSALEPEKGIRGRGSLTGMEILLAKAGGIDVGEQNQRFNGEFKKLE
jgi:hypothetical protein